MQPKHCSTMQPHETHDQRHSQPPDSRRAPARSQPPEEAVAHRRASEAFGKTSTQEGTHVGAEGASRWPETIMNLVRRPKTVSLSSGDSLPGHGTWHPVPYLLAPPQPHLIDVYYPSHAFPRQTNHQHKNPTSPPTTTTAATEMPAIAPVERPLLFALVDTQASPSSL